MSIVSAMHGFSVDVPLNGIAPHIGHSTWSKPVFRINGVEPGRLGHLKLFALRHLGAQKCDLICSQSSGRISVTQVTCLHESSGNRHILHATKYSRAHCKQSWREATLATDKEEKEIACQWQHAIAVNENAKVAGAILIKRTK